MTSQAKGITSVFELTANNICHRYAEPKRKGSKENIQPPWVLDHVSISVKESESVALIGASGSGKTTLIRICSGLLSPVQGDVLYAGKSIQNSNTLSEFRSRIGFMPQSAALFPHLTIADNATLGLLGRKASSQARDKRLKELLDMVKLPQSVAHKYPHQISGGQAQRVSLMRALCEDPDCLFLDEPLSALDPVVRSSLQDDLKQLVSHMKKALIVVTHDLAEAQFLTQKSYLLGQGKILQEGTISSFIQNPENEQVNTFVSSQRRLHVPA